MNRSIVVVCDDEARRTRVWAVRWHRNRSTGPRTSWLAVAAGHVLFCVMPRRLLSCLWCHREIEDSEAGRRRRYCRQSCRQRAYEHRNSLKGTGIPEDSVVLSTQEAADLADRWFAARCAAEDVATAVAEGAAPAELKQLSETLLTLTREAERLR